jgi:hypothetical protein
VGVQSLRPVPSVRPLTRWADLSCTAAFGPPVSFQANEVFEITGEGFLIRALGGDDRSRMLGLGELDVSFVEQASR